MIKIKKYIDMEFKGTKGKWKLEQSLFYKTDKVILSNHRAICRITIDNEESKANALLISKAPEMLDMLKECKRVLSSVQSPATPSILLYREIQQLIKEATEL